MATNDRLRTLLSDLGRATMRGIKKCQKCGTYNGSRVVSCKNKFCNAVFKETAERKKPSMDICRLVTESNTNIFSVITKEKGREHRAFVHLPVADPTATSDLALQDTTLCFVESCEIKSSEYVSAINIIFIYQMQQLIFNLFLFNRVNSLQLAAATSKLPLIVIKRRKLLN